VNYLPGTAKLLQIKEAISNAVIQPDAKRLKLCFKHPLGKLKYQFDKTNSEKLNNWLVLGDSPKTEANENSA